MGRSAALAKEEYYPDGGPQILSMVSLNDVVYFGWDDWGNCMASLNKPDEPITKTRGGKIAKMATLNGQLIYADNYGIAFTKTGESIIDRLPIDAMVSIPKEYFDKARVRNE